MGLLARSAPELNAAQLEIEHANGKAISFVADVRDFTKLQEAVIQMPDIFALVAVAGVQGPIGPLATSDPAGWQETFDINVLGVMNAIRAVLPGMIERRQGKIIIVTGGGAATARPNFAPYAASKAAVVRLGGVHCG